MLPNEILATTNIAIAIGIILDDEIGFAAIIFPKNLINQCKTGTRKKRCDMIKITEKTLILY